MKRKILIGCLKPRPNDRNMPTQHIATLLGLPCCVRLATVLRHVGCCWLKFEIWSNLCQQHPTCRNTSQHGGQTYATCSAQQCCDMLPWHIGIVWPGLKHPTCRNMLQHGGQTHATCCAQQCCDMLRGHVAIVWPGLKMDRSRINFGDLLFQFVAQNRPLFGQ